VKGPTRAVRLPEYLQDRIARALKAKRELTRDESGAPKDEVVGQQIGMTGDEVKNLIRLSQDTVSLEAPVSDSEGLAVGNTLVDESTRTPEDEADYRSRQKALVAGLGQLPPRQTRILAYRFGLADGRSRSRPWIGKQMGLSAERIRQIEKTALKALRRNLGVEGIAPDQAVGAAA
jgi:RNA polymerase primary sigma factor